MVGHGRPGVSAVAFGVGVFAFAFPLARITFVPFLGVSPVGEAAHGAFYWVIAVQLLGALAAGLVLGAFGRRHLIDAVVIVVFFIGPWSPQLRVPELFYVGFHLASDWQLFIPVGYALVALLGLGVGTVAARYRATSVPTIP
ncbi:MAG TPA: hypothetical protein VGS17_12955 [Candidatus Limnocylindria bacterium]|nr:hypothetical protein [Candidatus Limnocylindria bacterium]